ncbi:MAG: hypothetical protein AB1416_11840 [Actinomycetota bacterium]
MKLPQHVADQLRELFRPDIEATFVSPPVVGLETLQLSGCDRFTQGVDRLVHLVRRTTRGTPGPTLCGIDRFHFGFSVGGGISTITQPCHVCVEVARRMRFTAELPVTGMGAAAVDAAIATAALRRVSQRPLARDRFSELYARVSSSLDADDFLVPSARPLTGAELSDIRACLAELAVLRGAAFRAAERREER